jgi:hypothetical protein
MTNRDGSYGYQKMGPLPVALMLAGLAVAAFAVFGSHGAVRHAPLRGQTTHQGTP